MIDDHSHRRRALVVAVSDVERDRSCRTLIQSGYDVVGFADCANASAWLEEETPAVAVVANGLNDVCESLLEVLAERAVPISSAWTV